LASRRQKNSAAFTPLALCARIASLAPRLCLLLPHTSALTSSFTPASRHFGEVLEDGDRLKLPDPELVDAVNTPKLLDPEIQAEVVGGAPTADPKNGAGAGSTPASKPKNGNGTAPTSKPKNTTTKEKKRTGQPPLSPASSREGADAARSDHRPSSAATSSGGGGALTNTRPTGTSRKLLQPLM